MAKSLLTLKYRYFMVNRKKNRYFNAIALIDLKISIF